MALKHVLHYDDDGDCVMDGGEFVDDDDDDTTNNEGDPDDI